jgi:hypothetical protein
MGIDAHHTPLDCVFAGLKFVHGDRQLPPVRADLRLTYGDALTRRIEYLERGEQLFYRRVVLDGDLGWRLDERRPCWRDFLLGERMGRSRCPNADN